MDLLKIYAEANQAATEAYLLSSNEAWPAKVEKASAFGHVAGLMAVADNVYAECDEEIDHLTAITAHLNGIHSDITEIVELAQ